MKKLAWMLAVLPLVGAAFFHLSAPKTEQKATQSGMVKRQLDNRKGTNPKPKTPELLKFEEDIKQVINKFEQGAKEVGVRYGEIMTPEVQQKGVDLRLSYHGTAYQKLFASWNADPTTIEDIMRTIRERDLKLEELNTQFIREGTSSVGLYQKECQVVDDSAKNHLRLALGQERLDELTEMENS